MVDLPAVGSGRIETNVYSSPERESHLKVSAWGFLLSGFGETEGKTTEGHNSVVESIRQLAYPPAFISPFLARSTFQTHEFRMRSLLGDFSYFYYPKSGGGGGTGSGLCK